MCCSHSLFIPEICFFAFHRHEPQTEENVDDRDDPIAKSKSRGVDHVVAAKVEAAVIYCLILDDAGSFTFSTLTCTLPLPSSKDLRAERQRQASGDVSLIESAMVSSTSNNCHTIHI